MHSPTLRGHWPFGSRRSPRSTAVALRLVAALNTQIGTVAATSPDDGPTMRAFQKKVNAVTVAVKAGRKDELWNALEEARRALGRFLEP